MAPKPVTEMQLVEACLVAACQADGWRRALRLWGEFVGADEALVVADDFAGAAPRVAVSTRPPGDAIERIFVGKHRRNPWSESSLKMPAGGATRTDEKIPRAVLFESAFYRECLEPIGLLHALGGVLINEPGLFGFFGFLRSPRAGRFPDEALEQMARLQRHLAQALRLQVRLQSVELERDAAFESLDHMASGVVLVDERGEVCFANRAAEQVLSRPGALSGAAGRLRAAAWEDDRRLQRLLGEATSIDGGRCGGGLALKGEEGEQPVTLEVLPLGETGIRAGRARPRAAVFLGGASEPVRPPIELLREAFGLTAAEARVATELAEGLSPKEIAERLRVSANTVRTHLAHLFDKTGTRRQPQLVKRLSSVASGARGRGGR